MRVLVQPPASVSKCTPAPLWVVLHGAGATAEQAILLFGQEAAAHNAVLLAPEATRACDPGFCWAFAQDARSIAHAVARVRSSYPLDPAAMVVIGYSMGCTMGLWLLAQQPHTFTAFAALGMGSAFEPWEHDDGGIDLASLQVSAATTRVVLAVDRADPTGTNRYVDDNLAHLGAAGFAVTTIRPQTGTHAVTAAMKAAVLAALLS